MFIGATTEPPPSPRHVVDGCDAIGVYQQCLRCGRVNRLTTNGLRTVVGAAHSRGLRWAREHAECMAVAK